MDLSQEALPQQQAYGRWHSWVQRSTPILNFELPIQCTRLALDFRANLGQKRRGEQMYTVKRMVGLDFQ